jgi:hypothetical protein
MYTVGKACGTAFDSVYAAEATMKMAKTNEFEAAFTLVYCHGVSMNTFGSCRMTEALMSPETIASFKESIRLAEEDFGRLIFEGEAPATANPVQKQAESQRGLPKGIGGV